MEDSISKFNQDISNMNTSMDPMRQSPTIFLSPPTDPPRSPQLQLTRADLYRQKVNPRSNLEYETKRKKKEHRRLRTQSSPMFPQHLDTSDSTLGQENKDFPSKLIDKKLSRINDENLDKKDMISKVRSPSVLRKKSMSALMDLNLKKILDNGSTLKRSQSQKLSQKPLPIIPKKKNVTDDDDSDDMKEGSDPQLLFQATTLFVPGYDFKTKQRTSSVNSSTRKASTPVLPRRSSKERLSMIFDKGTKEKMQSTPCLVKRNSREKMKKMDLKDVEEETICKTISAKTPSPDHVPPKIIVNSQPECKDVNLPTSLNEDFTEHVTITQHQSVLAEKQNKILELKVSPNIDILPNHPANFNIKGSMSDEDGNAYVRSKNHDNLASNLLPKSDSLRIDFNTEIRNRARSCEIESLFIDKHKSEDRRSLQLLKHPKKEYMSSSDSHDLESSGRYRQSMQNGIDDLLSHSWSHPDRKDKEGYIDVSHNMNPAIEQVAKSPNEQLVSTDLCVTEL